MRGKVLVVWRIDFVILEEADMRNYRECKKVVGSLYIWMGSRRDPGRMVGSFASVGE